jgi:uncharacterized coiled-coil DUF342 family protein
MPVTENLEQLSGEVKELSQNIYLLKKQLANMTDDPEKDELRKTILRLQYQALFYIKKIDNLSKDIKGLGPSG